MASAEKLVTFAEMQHSQPAAALSMVVQRVEQ
jgi:hypothetical protein